MKPNALHNRKKSGSVPFTELVHLANTQNMYIDWLIFGTGPIYKDATVGSDDANSPAEKQARIVIERSKNGAWFDDIPRSARMIENLKKIEKINGQAFRELDSYIKGVAFGLGCQVADDTGEEKTTPAHHAEDRSGNQQKKIS